MGHTMKMEKSYLSCKDTKTSQVNNGITTYFALKKQDIIWKTMQNHNYIQYEKKKDISYNIFFVQSVQQIFYV